MKNITNIELAFKRCLATTTAQSTNPVVPLSAIKSTILLARSPIVTADLTPFEKVYYNYQEELQRRLMWTFPQYYYFRKGTLSERRFTAAQKGPVTKQPGVYYEKGTPDVVHNRERRLKQNLTIPKAETNDDANLDEISRPVIPNSRVTEADQNKDYKSLERLLPRTLYLLVKESGNEWRLPSFALQEDATPLHTIAETGLRELGGQHINTWSVSNTPAAVLKFNGGKLVQNSDEPVDAREYIIRSRILSGAFRPQGSVDYVWVAKEEVSERTGAEYFSKIEYLLSDV